MQRFAGKLVIVGLVMLLAACAGSGENRTAASIPAAGSPAAQVFSNRCSICHAVPHPARHDYAGWLHLLPLMEQRMAERGVIALNEQERLLILGYLKEYAR